MIDKKYMEESGSCTTCKALHKLAEKEITDAECKKCIADAVIAGDKYDERE